MEQSIEERFGLCKHCLCDTDRYCHSDCHIYSKYCGAVEQKRIDIDKADKWLKEHAMYYGYASGIDATYAYDADMLVKNFRKAMEK